MDPKIWGKHAWFFLESVALGYPDNPTPKEKKQYKEFFNSLKYVLPCINCRLNYMDNLTKYPLSNEYLENRTNLLTWVNIIHNAVRIETGAKPKTIQEVVEFYNKAYNKEEPKWKKIVNWKTGVIGGLIILVLLSGIIIYKKTKMTKLLVKQ